MLFFVLSPRSHIISVVQAVVLQGQLLQVQEHGDPEAARADKGVREAGEAAARAQGLWAVQEEGRVQTEGGPHAKTGREQKSQMDICDVCNGNGDGQKGGAGGSLVV